MTVWPSISAMSLGPFPLGRMLGGLYANEIGISVLTLGNLFCLLSIPLALVLYFKRIGPFVARRYRLTNKRVIIEGGVSNKELTAIELDKFDRIEIRVRGGQEWFNSGDLVFFSGNIEKFLLEGVSRPKAFLSICEKSHRAYVGVKQALENEPALA